MLAAAGHRDSFVVAWQSRWRGAAIAALAGRILFVAYRWILPVAAEYAAVNVPLSWEQGLGQEAIVFLEKRFSATELPIERRDGLTRRFEAIAPEDGRDYEIRYRARRSGRMRSRYPAA